MASSPDWGISESLGWHLAQKLAHLQSEARQLYEQAIECGVSPDTARELVKIGLDE